MTKRKREEEEDDDGDDDSAGLDARNGKDLTRLHIACRELRFHEIESLVRGGANVNAKTNHGETPLLVSNFLMLRTSVPFLV